MSWDYYFARLEYYVNKVIPYLVIVLFFLIVIEIFFHEIAKRYHTAIVITDSLIVCVFVVDLIYKYYHLKNIPKFLRYFWLDIIAVFPFFLMFRALELIWFLRLGDLAESSQSFIHVGLVVEEEAIKLTRSAESFARSESLFVKIFGRFSRTILRLPRLLKLIPQYSHLKMKHKLEKSA